MGMTPTDPARRNSRRLWSMADKSVGSSEMKEKLRTVLKSWPLYDPEIFSPGRSPLSTESSYGSGTTEDQIGTSNLARPELCPRIEEIRKRVHPHNCGSHSANSSLSGIRSDEGFRQGPLKGDPEERLLLPVNSVPSCGTRLSSPATSYRGISINTSSSRRRAARRARRVAASRKKDLQDSAISNVPDHSHNATQSYRENRGKPTNDQAQKIGSVLHSNFFDGILSCRSPGPERASESDMLAQKSLSRTYRPISFDEIIGQSIVVRSLNNAILKGRIAPAYIFQGPSGTGKTSIARILTAALNCLSTEINKPCGCCTECTSFITRNVSYMTEVDANSKKDIKRLSYIMETLSGSTAFSRYIVFVIEECHMLPSKSWSTFTKFLENPLPRVVFIFITTDPDNLQCNIASRCQKYIFHKIKDSDIACRLRKISEEEQLDFEFDALDLIALISDGSLRYAETMLDQLSLQGKRISTSLVNDLVGVIPNEKLLDLLEVALSSDTGETVKKSKELMDSGLDPVSLMSQLAGLIVDVMAGRFHVESSSCRGRNFSWQTLTESDLESLQQAWKILSDAENQLRLSSGRSKRFTATLLQLGTALNQKHHFSRCMSGQTNRKNDELSLSSIAKFDSKHHGPYKYTASQKDDYTNTSLTSSVSLDNLDEIWRRCIQSTPLSLREFLSAGDLVSLVATEGGFIAYIVFEDSNLKSKAEEILAVIKNSIELALKHHVEVKIGVSPQLPRTSVYYPKGRLQRAPKRRDGRRMYNDYRACSTKERMQVTSEQMTNISTVDGPTLEEEWLEAEKRGAAELARHHRSTALLMQQNGVSAMNQNRTSPAVSRPSIYRKNDSYHKIEGSSIVNDSGRHKEWVGEGSNQLNTIVPSSGGAKTCGRWGRNCGPIAKTACQWGQLLRYKEKIKKKLLKCREK